MKRALLIASSTYLKLGIENDVKCMTAVFNAYGFDKIDRCARPATSDVILSALTKLALDAHPRDTIVIYYTGHGGLARFDGKVAGREMSGRVWRYLVPEDARHSARGGRFRGVLDVDLGDLVGRIMTRRCRDVTLILECCFAGGMLAPRDAELEGGEQARGLVDVNWFEAPAWLGQSRPWADLLAEDDAAMPLIPGQAPIIVAATTGSRKAYESSLDGSGSDFTKVLAEELIRAKGLGVPWGRLINRVRAKVQRVGDRMTQVPHVIGPRGREVFGLNTTDLSRELEVVIGQGEELRLFAGGIQGLHKLDRFELRVPSCDELFGVARIRRLEPTRAWLELEQPHSKSFHERAGTPSRPVQLVATLREQSHPARVELIGESSTMDQLRLMVASSPWLVEEAESAGTSLRVTVNEGRLCIAGAGVQRECFPRTPRQDLSGDVSSPAHWVLSDLEALARTSGFLSACKNAAPPPRSIEFTLLVDGEELVGDEGAVHVGQSLCLDMRYIEPYLGETLFLNLVNIGVDGRAHLLNGSYNCGGLDLFSEHPDRTWGQSMTLIWPSEVPKVPMLEALYFVLTSRPLNLETLTRVDPDFQPEPGARSPRLLDELLESVDLYVHRRHFTLCPCQEEPCRLDAPS